MAKQCNLKNDLLNTIGLLTKLCRKIDIGLLVKKVDENVRYDIKYFYAILSTTFFFERVKS